MLKEIEPKSILIKSKDPSNWFGVKYYMNIYRGCMHGCIYCDSRSDCYHVDNFDQDISIKKNAIELLRKELSSKKEKGIIGFGSMSDAYIPLEKEYQMTRYALEVIKEFKYPVFILTKSNLVLKDLDLLMDINNDSYATVAFTITCYKDELAKIIEPKAPLPSERFMAMKTLSDAGINVGIMLAPLLPFIEDNEDNIKNIIEMGKKSGASFIVPTFGVTLRDKQREYYYQKLDQYFPSIKDKYIKKYGNQYFCLVDNIKIKNYFYEIAKQYDISTDMPTDKKIKNNCNQLSIFDII